jgi:hypothetical protein
VLEVKENSIDIIKNYVYKKIPVGYAYTSCDTSHWLEGYVDIVLNISPDYRHTHTISTGELLDYTKGV